MTTAHQRRAYPWFKESPATLLSDRKYKALSWAEKGLLWQLRCEYWVNDALPSAPDELDAIMGAERGMCARLIEKVRGHFIEEIDGCLHFPDLKYQREMQAQESERKANGGRKGGKASAAQRASERAAWAANDEAGAQAHPQGRAQAPYSPSISESHSTSGLQEADHGEIDDEFTRGYNETERCFPLGGHRAGAG